MRGPGRARNPSRAALVRTTMAGNLHAAAIMRHHRTCHLCEALCGLVIEHDDAGNVLSVRGDERDPLSRGHLCPKAAAIGDLHTDPDRLRTPVRRVGDRFEAVPWDEALDEAAERLHAVQQEHGRHAVALYSGNPSAHNYATLLVGTELHRTLRSRNRFSATSCDQLPHMLAALTMFGHQLALPVPDLERTRLLVIIGGNPLVSNGSLMTAPDVRHRLRDIRERGGRIVVLDPRRTETADAATEHHFVRPGSDALALAAMIHTLFDEGLVGGGPWRAWSDGLDDLADAVAPFEPERVADAVGISAATLRALARDIAETDGAAVYGRLGMTTQRFGGVAGWLLLALNTIAGQLDHPGGMMFPTPPVDLHGLAARIGQTGHFDRYRSRVRNLPEFGGELPAATLSDEIETPGDGQVRALITIAGNPVLSTPNGERLARAIDGLDFYVALDPFLTATSRRAHLVLPPLSPLERDHFGLVFHALAVRNTARYTPPMVPAPPGARDDWQTLLELAERLELRRGGAASRLTALKLRALRTAGPRRLLDLALRLGPYGMGRKGLSLAALRDAPSGIDHGPLQPRLPAHLYNEARRVQLAPAVYRDDLVRLEAAIDELKADTDGALRLIGRRHLRSNNSWLHNAPRLMKGASRCTALMHPDDAGARGLADGDDVVLASRVGEISLPVEVTPDIMPGVVSVPHGWGHGGKGARLKVASAAAGASANDLTDDTFLDELTGTAALSGVFVTARPAG